MKKIFYKFCPLIFAFSGILLVVINYIVEAYLPEHLKIYTRVATVMTVAVLGLLLGGLLKKLHNFGYTDILTGVKNRAYFYSRMNCEIKRAKKRKTYLSLLMIDVDNFKLVNDTYGHLAGDKILKQMAHTLIKVIGNRNQIIRWGGEEFTVILPDTSPELAYRTAELMRKEIETCHQIHSICQGRITISAGVATVINPDGVDDIVKIADRALYKAKEKKNIVVSSAVHLKDIKVSNL